MEQHQTVKDVYGPGTYTDTEYIPPVEDCERLLKHLASISPGFTKDAKALAAVQFHGSDLPILPSPIKAQALSAVIHAMIGIASKEILQMKGIDPGKIVIDVDKAGMYPASASIISIGGKTIGDMHGDGTLLKLGKDVDHGVLGGGPLNFRSWAIYPTKDNQWYQILSSLSPEKYLQSFNIDPKTPAKSVEDAYELIKAEVSKYTARELEQKSMELGVCGQTCYAPKAWNETTMGKTLARHPLVSYKMAETTEGLPPIPFPSVPGDKRPLAGVKVIELARVIAAPALGAVLTSLGAEVVKINSPVLPDMQPLQLSLTVGKYTCSLDLSKDSDRARLHKLMEDADVIIRGFRRRSLERKGFGLEHLLEVAQQRNKGIVYLDLSCYGPDGYYAERPGYQQCADAPSGCCYVLGKAYGYEEGTGILPSLPIADMLTGAVGALEVIMALRDRASKGGSYDCEATLTAVDTIQLTEEFGLYQPEIVQKIQDTHKFLPMKPEHHVEDLMFMMLTAWYGSTDLLQRKHYYTHFAESPYGKDHLLLGPIVEFEDREASPHWTSPPEPYCYHDEVKWKS